MSTATAVLTTPSLEVYTLDATHSEVSFQVRHLVTNVRGRFNDFDAVIRLDPADEERSTVEFRVKAASIDTNLPDRDAHLRSADFFDVDNHPEIVFKSRRIESAGGDRYRVIGELTMRGITREIALEVTFLGTVRDPWGNEKAGFETEAVLNRKDFGMVWNAALDNGGVILGDKVKVHINLEALRMRDGA
jgi:polyisoprenoid-binding protein YceI